MSRDMNEKDILSSVWPEWKIVEFIGSGSYGRVYKAVRDEFSIKSFSAIKIISIPQNNSEIRELHAEGYDDIAIRKYYQNIASQLMHEMECLISLKDATNIVKIYDFKVVDKEYIGCNIYLRMELLIPFNQYILDKKLSQTEIIKLGRDICKAIECCSEQNIVHRDIKPDNILVSEHGEFKLGDFGIAKRLDEYTSTISYQGFSSYIAPEVIKGEKYNTRADIYSLGIVLYKLLNNNRLPFVSQMGNMYESTMIANRRRLEGEKIQAPANADKELSAVILRACEYEPDKRFQSPVELGNALAVLHERENIIPPIEIRGTDDAEKTLVADQIMFETGQSDKKKTLAIGIMIMVLFFTCVVFFVMSANKMISNNEDKAYTENSGITETAEITQDSLENMTIEHTDEENAESDSKNTDEENDELRNETIDEETTENSDTSLEEITNEVVETEGEFVTEEITIENTVTDELTTKETITNESTTEKPTTEEPMTEEPTTEEPTMEEPTTEELTTEEPTTEEPTTEESTTEEPTTEELTTEEPTTEEPTTEESTTEEPTTEESTTEEPTTEKSTEEKNVYIVPSGCVYLDASENKEYPAGSEINIIPQGGDSLRTEDYIYYYDNFSRTSYTWRVYVKDKTKTAYEPIMDTIAGKKVKNMHSSFYRCVNLKTAPKIPDTIDDLYAAFSGCESLETAPELPPNIKALDYTFQNCVKLKEIPEIPKSVNSLIYTFDHCSNLKDILAIPDNVTDMTGTFAYCYSIETVESLPSQVRSLDQTFYYCESLIKAPEIPIGVETMVSAFEYCERIREAPAIPGTVKIMSRAFLGCEYLEKVPVIPNGVEDMYETFKFCRHLKEIPTIPASVKDMTYTFSNCSLTGKIIVNANPEKYRGCFFGNSSITLEGDSSMLEELSATITMF